MAYIIIQNTNEGEYYLAANDAYSPFIAEAKSIDTFEKANAEKKRQETRDLKAPDLVIYDYTIRDIGKS